MKLSLEWLSDFVDLVETDPEAIARAVTAHVAEVDEVEVQGAFLENVAVGNILTLRKHPNADKLSLVEVHTDRGTKRVVCGGTNLREGMLIAFAHVGAVVRHGAETFTLEKAKIRGEESEGMICAAEELALEGRFPTKPEDGNRPIMDLSPLKLTPGQSLKEALRLDDVVLHIDNHAITHRADLFSHKGFAREFVAMGIAKWKAKPSEKQPAFPDAALPFRCVVQNKKLMPRYCACLLEISGAGETPDWMKRRLEATGWRSISLAVDITNYVMMEIGVPLHSFDADDLKGDIRVRAAKKGEKLTTLDGIERALNPGAIVISDDDGIFDLLGIMGGLRSSTKPSTHRIYLHSASLDPSAIRKTVAFTGHRTEASTVYEKGVPPITTKEGFFRALQLFLELVPGARIASTMETYGEDGKPKAIPLSLKRIDGLLGAPVTLDRARDILGTLGFETAVKGKTLRATPPLWRLGDVRGDHDLIEEVGRIMGYDTIEAIMPKASTIPPPRDHRRNVLRDALKELRYVEILPLSLIGEGLIKKAGLSPETAVAISNPLGEEMRNPHPSVLPGLLEHAERNLAIAGDRLRTFTMSRVFRREGKEFPELGMLRCERNDDGIKSDPFLLLKRDVESALASLRFQVSWQRETDPPASAHPGKCARIVIDGEPCGLLFALHPSVAGSFDLPPCAAATLDMSALLGRRSAKSATRVISAFPAVTYDVTVPRTRDQSTETLLTKLRSSSPLLEGVEIIDLYGTREKKEFNLTLRFTYRAADRTLTEHEAKAEQEKALAILSR